MGISYRAYCGPYLRCTKKMTTTVDKYPGCVNKGCPNLNKESRSKFCPQCGNAIGLYEVERQVQVGRSLWDLFDGKEPFSIPFAESGPKSLRDKYDILVSNYRQDYDPDCEDEETRRQFSVYVYNTSTCQDLTATDRQQEMDDFVTRHKKYIDKLKEVYGENEVVLCWGFLTWAS